MACELHPNKAGIVKKYTEWFFEPPLPRKEKSSSILINVFAGCFYVFLHLFEQLLDSRIE